MFNLSHCCVSVVAVSFKIDKEPKECLSFMVSYVCRSYQDTHCRQQSTHLAAPKITYTQQRWGKLYSFFFLPKVSGNTVAVIFVQYWHKTTPGHSNPYYLSLTPYDGLLSRLPFMRARDMAKSHPRQCKTRSFEWRDTRDGEVLAQQSFVSSWTEKLPEKKLGIHLEIEVWG